MTSDGLSWLAMDANKAACVDIIDSFITMKDYTAHGRLLLGVNRIRICVTELSSPDYALPLTASISDDNVSISDDSVDRYVANFAHAAFSSIAALFIFSRACV